MRKVVCTRRKLLIDAALTPLVLVGGPWRAAAANGTPPAMALPTWIGAQRARSSGYLLRNISPPGPVERSVEVRNIAPDRLAAAHRAAVVPDAPLRFEGDRFIQRIVPSAGSVLAADRGKPDEPDYAFHWIRDSSLIMRAIATHLASDQARPAAALAERWLDYLRFSRSLQLLQPTVGPGEVRFNLDGSEDYLQWSRPQFDGPPLRALAMLHYRSLVEIAHQSELTTLLTEALRQDLDEVAEHWNSPGFDLWEEYLGHDFHARTVQVGALQAGARWARGCGDRERAERYGVVERQLRAALAEHWLPAKGYYGFHAGSLVYWDGKERVKPGDNFDAAVVTAAVHSRLTEGPCSLLDDRVLASAIVAEDLFTGIYAINVRRRNDEGILYGRYAGDTYYGGNPFVFITLEFAEAYYRIAALLARRRSYVVTPLNRTFLARALSRAGGRHLPNRTGEVLEDAALRRALLRGLILRGDDILRAVQRLTPASGELPEQFDQHDGSVASSRNVSWSHAALLAATQARLEASRVI